MRLLLVLTVLTALLTGCTKSTPPPACSTASNVDDPTCAKQVGSNTTTTPPTTVSFAPAHYYNQNAGSWSEDLSSLVTSGNLGLLPIYSNVLSASAADALSSVVNSEVAFTTDNTSPGSCNPDACMASGSITTCGCNFVPYFKLSLPTATTNAVYNYTKYDSSGNAIAIYNGTMPVNGNYAYLPISNAYFANHIYDATEVIGTIYNHQISVALQSANIKNPTVTTVQFKTAYVVPSLKFNQIVSDPVANMTLANRWNAFAPNGVTNTSLDFAYLKQKGAADALARDVRLTFRERPKLQILVEPINEIPVNTDVLQSTGAHVLSRGYKFIYKTITLNSTSDFNLKMTAGTGSNLVDISSPVVANGDTETVRILNNFPANVPIDLQLSYNLSQNSAYNSANKTPFPLLHALRPECWEIKKAAFDAVSENAAKEAAINGGNYRSICDAKFNRTVDYIKNGATFNTVNPVRTGLQAPYNFPSGLEIGTDTFFNFFNYYPVGPVNSNNGVVIQDAGGLYGIKSMMFYIEGCVKVEVKARGALSSSYQVVSDLSQCGAAPAFSGTSFVVAKTLGIGDNIAQWAKVPGLVDLLNTIPQSGKLEYKNSFYFNTEVLDSANLIRHLY